MGAAGLFFLRTCASNLHNPQAKVYLADVTKEDTIKSTVSSILADAASAGLPISSLIYNPSYFVMKSFLETPASEFANGFSNQVLGLVHFAQGFLPKLVEQGSGSILVTGATAALRAGNGFSTFAVAKFGCRALAQSLAREFGPKGVHVAHFVGCFDRLSAIGFSKSDDLVETPTDSRWHHPWTSHRAMDRR